MRSGNAATVLSRRGHAPARARRAFPEAPSRRRPPEPVARPRLYALLEQGTSGLLTLVSAPPGWGKTTLLRSWTVTRRRSGPVVWLSPAEHGGAAFLDRLESAVAAAPGAGEPLVVVVDDFHEARSEAVHEEFARTITRARGRLHAVVATRRNPEIDLHRLRLAGSVTELGSRELAFDRSEAVKLLASHAVAFEPDRVEALMALTEGWAAGLEFAAAALQARGGRGSDRAAIARAEREAFAYLRREVMPRRGSGAREFLLRTAICDRICGALADAITGDAGGERMLARLQLDNVFVAREPNGEWFRYHPIFAALLREEAGREFGAGTLERLHGRAAAWFAAAGEGVEALGHAGAAGDCELASRLVSMLWVDLMGGAAARAGDALLERLDPAALASDPQLILLAAWSNLQAGATAEAGRGIAAADAAAGSLAGADADRYRFARSMLLFARARRAGDLVRMERATDTLGQPTALVRPIHDNERRRAIVLVSRGCLALWRGELEFATSAVGPAIDACRRLGLSSSGMHATSLLAFARAVRGELRQAAELGAAAVAAASGDPSPVPALANAALAICAYEWGENAAGERDAIAARAAARACDDRLGLVAATVAWGTGLGRGLEPGVAREWLHELGACSPPPLLAPAIEVIRARIELAEGRPAAARALLDRAPPSPEVLVARAQLLLAEDGSSHERAEHAAELVAPVVVRRIESPFARTRIEAAVVSALATHRLRRTDASRGFLELALGLSEAEGIRGPFLDAGSAIAEPLRLAVRRGTSHRWLAAALLAAFDGRRSVEQGVVPLELASPLSEREEAVLRYLSSRMSNQEIAGELMVSVNTIKTHLKSIYRKLGASHRREAALRARELRLIGS